MKVPIEALNTPELWHLGGSTAKLRIYADQPFQTSLGQWVPQGTPGALSTFYLEIPCTITGGQLLITGFELDSTVDALVNPFATYTAELVSESGKRVTFLANFPVNTLEVGDPSTTWPEIFTARDMIVPQTLSEPLSRQIQSMISTAVGDLNRASITNTGVVAITWPPLDPVFPIAVSDTDPRWEALVAGSGSSQVFNVKDYGAVADGVTDDTAAVLEALEAALDANGILFFPGFCRVSGNGTEILLVNKSIEIRGSGRSTSGLIVAASVPNTTDIIRIAPPAIGGVGPNVGSFTGRNNRGYYLNNFSIMNDTGTSPAGTGGGRNAVRVDTTIAGSFLHSSVIERVDMLRLSNAPSMVFDNESGGVPANTDGIWNIMVRDCLIFDGFLGRYIGDNISLRCNQFREFTSNNPAIDVYQVHNAIGLAIRDNHIYNKLGVRVRGGQKPVIDHNIIEAPDVDTTGTDGAILNLSGDIAVVEAPSVTNNRLHGRSGAGALNAVVRVDNCRDAYIGFNYYQAPAGQPAVRTTANAVRTRIDTVILDPALNAGGAFASPMLGTDNQYGGAVRFSPLAAIDVPGSAPGFFQVEEARPLRFNLSDTTTPTWNSGFRPAMFGANSSVVGDVAPSGAASFQQTQNAYLDAGGVWRYISSGPASNISFVGGAIVFRTAPAGNAGDPVIWLIAWRVNSAGFANNTVGANVAVAGTIVPTGNVFTITGSGTISTIDTTSTTPGTVLYMVTAAAVTFDEAGNIEVSGAASLVTVAGQLVIALWDGTKWRVR